LQLSGDVDTLLHRRRSGYETAAAASVERRRRADVLEGRVSLVL
jgi:hypothetical protein